MPVAVTCYNDTWHPGCCSTHEQYENVRMSQQELICSTLIQMVFKQNTNNMEYDPTHHYQWKLTMTISQF